MKNFKVLLKVFRMCKEFWVEMCFLCIALVLSGFLSTYPIKYIKEVIDTCMDFENPGRFKAFFIASGIYLILHILNIVFRGIFEYLNVHLETKIGHKIRMALFHKLKNVPFNFYEKKSSADLIVRLLQDSAITVDGILKPLTFIVKDTILFIFGFYFMAKIDFQITLMMVPIGVVLSAYAVKTGPKINHLSQKERMSNTALWEKFTESIKGMKEIRAYRQEEKFAEDISKRSIRTNKNILGLNKYIIVTSNINSAFFMAIISFIMILGGYKVSLGVLSIGGLTSIMMYNGMLIDPMLNFFSFYQQMQRVIVSTQRIFDILDEEEIHDIEASTHMFKEKIHIKNVSFNYSDKNTLSNVDFSFKKGKKIAFVGHSGSGKSTICKLLIKFAEVNKGEILIDDVNIKDIKTSNVRDIFGIVFQDTFLFSGTLRENLLFAKPNASEKELQEAIKISGMDLFIDGLPKKINTVIGENGVNLSGGERQRISIARAILRSPEVLILDESTSALDPITTAEIMKNIMKLYNDKTVIFTAHKLTTISNLCDEIFVFEKGKLVENGDHIELMKTDSLYKKIYDAQFVEMNKNVS